MLSALVLSVSKYRISTATNSAGSDSRWYKVQDVSDKGQLWLGFDTGSMKVIQVLLS